MCMRAKTMATLVKKLISTPNAPRPVAPYNQAVLVDRTVYVSGVLGLDKDTMKLVEGGTAEEAKAALTSMSAILTAAGSCIDNIVKVNILLKDISEFGKVNEVYGTFFTKDFPARIAYQAGALPLGASVEIECIAIAGDMKAELVTGSGGGAGGTGCTSCGPSGCPCSKAS